MNHNLFRRVAMSLATGCIVALTACGAQHSMLPKTPSTASANGVSRVQRLCPSRLPSGMVACSTGGGGDGWGGSPNPGGGGAGCGTGGGQATLIARKSENGCGGTGGGEILACRGRAQDCANVPCFGSPGSVGAIMDPMGSKGNITIIDMNSLWVDGVVVGWMYLGGDKNRYVQANDSSQQGVSFGVSIGFASVAVTPGTSSPITHWNGMFQPGTSAQKCSSLGALLV